MYKPIWKTSAWLLPYQNFLSWPKKSVGEHFTSRNMDICLSCWDLAVCTTCLSHWGQFLKKNNFSISIFSTTLPTFWGENHWWCVPYMCLPCPGLPWAKYDTATWHADFLDGKVRKWSSEQVGWYEIWLQLSGCEKPCKQSNSCSIGFVRLMDMISPVTYQFHIFRYFWLI